MNTTKRNGMKIVTEEVYHDDIWVTGSRICVDYDTRKKAKYLFMHIKNGGHVMVCPYTTDGKFVMTRQLKPAAGITTEFVAGNRNKGETWEKAACREMKEEVEFSPGKLVKIGSFMNVTDRMDNKCHLFLALDCTPTARELGDEIQNIEVVLMTERELRQAIRSHKIKDMATVLGFQSFLLYRAGLL